MKLLLTVILFTFSTSGFAYDEIDLLGEDIAINESRAPKPHISDDQLKHLVFIQNHPHTKAYISDWSHSFMKNTGKICEKYKGFHNSDRINVIIELRSNGTVKKSSAQVGSFYAPLARDIEELILKLQPYKPFPPELKELTNTITIHQSFDLDMPNIKK